ncbi:MAG: UrcA family protein [Sphingomonadaceae bacterium]|nr:UrcA family protein [Sphingomonadaceae bacterium]
MNVRSTLLALAATAAATLTLTVAVAPAAAQAVSTSVTIQVPYSDLNLASPTGRAALDRRVFRAATLACGQDMRDLNMSLLSRACRDDAIAAARGQREAALRSGVDYASARSSVSQAAF